MAGPSFLRKGSLAEYANSGLSAHSVSNRKILGALVGTDILELTTAQLIWHQASNWLGRSPISPQSYFLGAVRIKL